MNRLVIYFSLQQGKTDSQHGRKSLLIEGHLKKLCQLIAALLASKLLALVVKRGFLMKQTTLYFGKACA